MSEEETIESITPEPELYKKVNFKIYKFIDRLLGFTDLIPYNYYVLKNDFTNVNYYKFEEQHPDLENYKSTRLMYFNESGVDSFYGRTFYDEDNDYLNIRQLFHDFLININVVPDDKVDSLRTVDVTNELIERYFYDEVWEKFKKFNIFLLLASSSSSLFIILLFLRFKKSEKRNESVFNF